MLKKRSLVVLLLSVFAFMSTDLTFAGNENTPGRSRRATRPSPGIDRGDVSTSVDREVSEDSMTSRICEDGFGEIASFNDSYDGGSDRGYEP